MVTIQNMECIQTLNSGGEKGEGFSLHKWGVWFRILKEVIKINGLNWLTTDTWRACYTLQRKF